MVWVGSLLLFLVVGAGLVALAWYRKSLHDDGEKRESLPPEILIDLARANEAALRRHADEGDPSAG